MKLIFISRGYFIEYKVQHFPDVHLIFPVVCLEFSLGDKSLVGRRVTQSGFARERDALEDMLTVGYKRSFRPSFI